MKYLLLLGAAIFFINCDTFTTNTPPKDDEKTGYQIGDIASDFVLRDVTGPAISLKNYTDAKGFVIIFTCNHCPFSIANEDRIIALDKKYKKLGYPVIAINPNDPAVNEDDSFENMILRAREKGFTFPYVLDQGQEVYPLYGATKTPHIYILQKTTKGLQVKYIGALDNSAKDTEQVTERYAENALNDLLAGKDPKVAETKAIGCSIKVKK